MAIDILWVIRPATLGVDARHYQRAASAWLAGGDPWSVKEIGIAYAAGPRLRSCTPQLPGFRLQASTALWIAIGVAASFWVVQRLGLPMWWLLFPPLVHAMWNANPQTLMLALLVVGTALAGALAAIVKLYALLPLAFHPSRLVTAIAVLLVTIPLLPWQLYVEHGLGVGSHLNTAWNGSAWRLPFVVPPVLLALWVLRKQGGEWFAVPAVFPATQFYYVSTALPALVGRRWLAAAFAVPVPMLVPLTVVLLAILSLVARQPASGASRSAAMSV